MTTSLGWLAVGRKLLEFLGHRRPTGLSSDYGAVVWLIMGNCQKFDKNHIHMMIIFTTYWLSIVIIYNFRIHPTQGLSLGDPLRAAGNASDTVLLCLGMNCGHLISCMLIPSTLLFLFYIGVWCKPFWGNFHTISIGGASSG